jgi:hypothetical protein
MILRHLSVVLAVISALVVTGTAQAQTWHRADTHHFVIYSNGSQKDLDEFAHKAEKFDALLRIIFRRVAEDDPNRLTIYLLNDSTSVANLISPKRNYVAGFYSPSADGSYAVANRQKPVHAYDLDGQTVLFHEYAHHFMYRNFAVPVPAWFSEGFAEFAATADFRKDGRYDFGKPAYHRAPALLTGPKIPIRKLLTERASGTIDQVSAFYGWSWALTHMFYRSEEHGGQIGRYLAALADGVEPLAAAEAEFGDLDELEKRLGRYIRGGLTSSYAYDIVYKNDIRVQRLSPYDSTLVELTLQRKAGHRRDRTRERLMQLVARPEATAEAWYQLAELEYAEAHREEANPRYDFTAAEAAVDRALALDAKHVLANVLKGDILLEPFDHADDTPDSSLWDAARKFYVAANRADPLHPLPLYKFGNTFLREGVENPQVGDALYEAFLGAPEATELRYALANHYARERDFDRAIHLLKVIAGNPHTGSGAREYIEKLEEARATGGEVNWSPPELDDEEDED